MMTSGTVWLRVDIGSCVYRSGRNQFTGAHVRGVPVCGQNRAQNTGEVMRNAWKGLVVGALTGMASRSGTLRVG
jgi:hypothetical protein